MTVLERLIDQAKEKFGIIVKEQLERIEVMKKGSEMMDYSKVNPIIIGVCFGDGIGEVISKHAQHVLEHVLEEEIEAGKIQFKDIAGLTIENRAKHKKAIPNDVLEELKTCHVILKGPTTTPQAGDEWPNFESANVAMRRYLDLFANVRPVKILQEGIDWCFFRENTEGAYVLGSRGINVSDDLSIDFKVITEQGAERIIRMAFDYAKKNNILKTKEDSLSGDDVREGLTAIISVKIPEPQFEGQTKTKLGNSEVKGFVDSIVTSALTEFFEENPSVAKKITSKALDSAKARLAAKKAKDLVRRKNAFSLGGLPGKLSDCSNKK